MSQFAPKMRAIGFANGPLRSVNNYQYGFYEIGAMRQALAHSGEDFFRVGALPLPTNEYEFNQIQKIISHPSIQYALVDKTKIVVTQIGNNTEWLSIFTDMGFKVKGGGKTAKRLKAFHRPTLINVKFNLGDIFVQYVDSADYSRYEFLSNYTEDEVDRLLDGGFIIHPRLIKAGVDNLPAFEAGSTNDPNEYYYNPRMRQNAIKDLLNTKAFNARIIGPDGFLKGNCFVSDKLPEDVDVLTWHGNLKSEIVYEDGWFFQAEPQNAKSRVHTDDQTMVNMPQLFTKSEMEYWLSEEYEKMFQEALNGKLLSNWKNIYQRTWKDKVDPEDEEAQARMQYVGYRWVAMGMKVTESPWMFETLATSHAKPLKTKIPIPCAVYEQIISESMARMAGFDIEVEEGTIQRLNELQVHVVNDQDWIEMYASHGGCDQDDFFKLFYREFEGGDLDGQKSVIVVRSPNGIGEYSIFKYVEGAWHPHWLTSTGEKVTFPKVSGRGWVQRLSEALAEGVVSYVGLPSQVNPPPKRTSEVYTREDVMHDVRTSMATGSVGRFVNASMLHSSVFGTHREQQLCSLEDAIDGFIQTAIAHDRECIDEDATTMVREVILSGLPVDRALWDSRRFDGYLKKGEWVEKYEGVITQLNDLCKKYYLAYAKRVHDWAQENARPSEFIDKIGYRMSFHALPILRKFRMEIYNVNSQMTSEHGGHVDRSGWDNLYKTIVDKIESYECESDRHDLVLGLYSASLKHKTSSGKITDQLVMNRLVFPYLERALQFYGIATRVTVSHNNDGSIAINQVRTTNWEVVDEAGTVHSFDDPLDYQRYCSRLSPVTFSSAKAG